MIHWQEGLRTIQAMTRAELEADAGQYSSRFYRVFVDPATGDVTDALVIGDLAGWIFSYEEKGARMKA